MKYKKNKSAIKPVYQSSINFAVEKKKIAYCTLNIHLVW